MISSFPKLYILYCSWYLNNNMPLNVRGIYTIGLDYSIATVLHNKRKVLPRKALHGVAIITKLASCLALLNSNPVVLTDGWNNGRNRLKYIANTHSSLGF